MIVKRLPILLFFFAKTLNASSSTPPDINGLTKGAPQLSTAGTEKDQEQQGIVNPSSPNTLLSEDLDGEFWENIESIMSVPGGMDLLSVLIDVRIRLENRTEGQEQEQEQPDQERREQQNIADFSKPSKIVPEPLAYASVETIIEKIHKLYTEDPVGTKISPPLCDNNDISNIAVKAQKLREATREKEMEDVVRMMDHEMGKLIASKGTMAQAVVLLGCFDDIWEELLEIAFEIKALDLLRAFKTLNDQTSIVQLYQSMIFDYGSGSYNKEIWEALRIDWSVVKLDVILSANNPKFLEAFLANKLPFTGPHSISKEQLLNLIAEHDFLDLYMSLNFATHAELAKCIEKLARSGSVKLLRIVHKFLDVNLGLDKYGIPEKLPGNKEDWKFLLGHGYRYLKVSQILTAACEGGHVYILEYFRAIDESLIPETKDFELAASKGHLNVLKWVKGLELSNIDGESVDGNKFLLNAILFGHFDIYDWLVKEWKGCNIYSININLDEAGAQRFRLHDQDIVQYISDVAAKSGRLNVVKWLYSFGKVVPDPNALQRAGARMLRWVQSKDPSKIDRMKAVLITNLSTVKWLWGNRRDLCTEKLLDSIASQIDNEETMEWISANWNRRPYSFMWSTYSDDPELFERVVRVAEKKLSEWDVKCLAREGRLEILKWICKRRPDLVSENIIVEALKNGHTAVASHFGQLFGVNYYRSSKGFVNLDKDCTRGYLDNLKWAFETFNVLPSFDEQSTACYYGHLKLVKWMVQGVNCVKIHDATKLRHETLYQGHAEIYLYLTKTFGIFEFFPDELEMCWERGYLEILKIIFEIFKSRERIDDEIKPLLAKPTSAENRHLREWLLAQMAKDTAQLTAATVEESQEGQGIVDSLEAQQEWEEFQ